MSGIVEVIQKGKLKQQICFGKLEVTYCKYKIIFVCRLILTFSLPFIYSYIFVSPSLPVYVSRPLSANFEGISPLSVWLWLQNFNSKPNMLIYLWTKAWISQFVACHLGRGQRRNVLMNLKSGLHSSNGTKIEFYWNTHFIFYQNLLKYLLISFLAHSRFYEKRQVTI